MCNSLFFHFPTSLSPAMSFIKKKNIFLALYTVFILATPLPNTEPYTLLVNWVGYLMSNVPVFSFRSYLKRLPPNQNTLLHSLLIMLMYELYILGGLTAIFPTVLRFSLSLKNIDYLIYSAMYTQSEIFFSLLIGVSTQCITIALIILSFFPVKFMSFNTIFVKRGIQIGIVLFSMISTLIVNLSCRSICSVEMYIFGSIINGMFDATKISNLDHCALRIVVKVVFVCNAFAYILAILIIPKWSQLTRCCAEENPSTSKKFSLNDQTVEETNEKKDEKKLLFRHQEKTEIFDSATTAKHSEKLISAINVSTVDMETENAFDLKSQNVSEKLRDHHVENLNRSSVTCQNCSIQSLESLIDGRTRLIAKPVLIVGILPGFAMLIQGVMYILVGIPWLRDEHPMLLTQMFMAHAKFILYIIMWIWYFNNDKVLEASKLLVLTKVRRLVVNEACPTSIREYVLIKINNEE